MRKILTLVLLLISFMSNAQVQKDTFEIETVNKFSNFNFNSECSDTVLVTTIKGNQVKSRYVLKNSVSTKVRDLIQNKPGMNYVSSGSYNEYVVTIAQVESNKTLRFITLFRSYQTNKIAVIEIEDNR
jgi:hypothetical protein